MTNQPRTSSKIVDTLDDQVVELKALGRLLGFAFEEGIEEQECWGLSLMLYRMADDAQKALNDFKPNDAEVTIPFVTLETLIEAACPTVIFHHESIRIPDNLPPMDERVKERVAKARASVEAAFQAAHQGRYTVLHLQLLEALTAQHAETKA